MLPTLAVTLDTPQSCVPGMPILRTPKMTIQAPKLKARATFADQTDQASPSQGIAGNTASQQLTQYYAREAAPAAPGHSSNAVTNVPFSTDSSTGTGRHCAICCTPLQRYQIPVAPQQQQPPAKACSRFGFSTAEPSCRRCSQSQRSGHPGCAGTSAHGHGDAEHQAGNVHLRQG